MSTRPQVVIIGGGFGGLSAAQRLKNASVDVTLIDRRNFHLFQLLLYQVATGSLAPGEIAAPLRGVLSKQKNARALLGDVVDIKPGKNSVQLADGAIIPYDFLIVAADAESSYYGNDAWRVRKIENREPLQPFVYFDKSSIAVIGPAAAAAVANAFGVKLSGFFAWGRMGIHPPHVHRPVSKQAAGVYPVGISGLTFSRSSRLITGPTTTDFNFNEELAAQGSEYPVVSEFAQG